MKKCIFLLSIFLVSCGDSTTSSRSTFVSSSGGVYFGMTVESTEANGKIYLAICCNHNKDKGWWVEADKSVLREAGMEPSVGGAESIEANFYLEPKTFPSSPHEYIPLNELKFKVTKIEPK